MPNVGDFTLLGWTTTLLYAVACYLTFRTYDAYHRCRHTSALELVQRKGWALIFVHLFLIGINKQLDFQYLLTEGGKYLVVALELNSLRRAAQVAVFLVAAMLALLSASLAIPAFLRGSSFLRTAFIGLGFIATYVLIRAALFQKISQRLDIPLIAYLEPLGVMITIWGATGQLRSLNKQARGS